ncbi:MAG: cytochrome c peroxidase [Bacteroidota bacterium]
MLIWVLHACSTNDVPTPLQLEEPANFVKMAIPEDNPLTVEGTELGRYLFYDPILSSTQTVSCASCHRQRLAFSDGKAKSVGIRGRVGKRSALPLFNVGYYHRGLFWDGRIQSLEQQVHLPVNDTLEMGANWPLVIERIKQHPSYPEQFEQAFGITASQIDSTHIMKALAQFQRTLISSDSKYDRIQRGEATFSESEKRGWTIFFDAAEHKELPFSECGHCHLDPLFTTQEYMNNGIEVVSNLEGFPDAGRGAVSGIKYDNGKFRTPSLRNIELTAPYMHDGRFETLEEVIDHYVTGGHFAENVNPNVQKLHFSERDKADIIAFLKTLTDTTFVTNPAYASPF